MPEFDKAVILQAKMTKAQVDEKFISFRSVTGVTHGAKVVDGKESDKYAIIFYVKEKGVYPPGEKIPAAIMGVPTDVIECNFKPAVIDLNGETPEVSPDKQKYEPFQGGCSTFPGRIKDGAGTMGIQVLEVGAKESPERLLSNWHVLCVDKKWEKEDKEITQPAVFDGGSISTDTIGKVLAGHLGKVERTKFYVDCAKSDLSGRNSLAKNIIQIGEISGSDTASEKDPVEKYGRTTRLTKGYIADNNFTVKIPYKKLGEEITFFHQYLIKPEAGSENSFAKPGDSGSIIVKNDGEGRKKAVGLLFAITEENPPYAGVANPIYMVEDTLNITFVG